MSVRKRVSWANGEGDEKTAWVVDYVDGKGRRRLKTFPWKKDADAFEATATRPDKRGNARRRQCQYHGEDGGSVLDLPPARKRGLERSSP